MHHYSARELRDRFHKGELTATAIVQHHLGHIAEHDHNVGAFLTVLKDRALQKAAELDAKRSSGKPLGKLAGVPVALKDNIHLRGVISTCGSKFLENYRAVFDATVTELLEREDAIIIGKTNMDEFAMGSSTENSAYKMTKNPWDLNCTPGGSSGGSAAAVSARMCPLALGSDTGGSIRQPAAFSGIVGFKPTYGRVSRYGLVAFASSFDQIGPMAANVTDTALMMEVIGQHDDRDSTSLKAPVDAYVSKLSKPISGGTIGVPWRFLEGLAPEAKANFEASLEVYKKLGVKMVDVDLDVLKYGIAIYYILATAEASTNLARFDGIRYGKRSTKAQTLDEVYDFSRKEGFGPEVKNRILLGTYVLSAGFQDQYYKKAQKVRTLIIQQFKKAFEKCQMVAMPMTPFPAFQIGAIQDPLQMYLQDIYTVCSNLAGIPAISIPSGFSKDNKPLGLQLLGPQLHDAQVLNYAYAFEQTTDFHKKLPPLVKP